MNDFMNAGYAATAASHRATAAYINSLLDTEDNGYTFEGYFAERRKVERLLFAAGQLEALIAH